MSDYKEKKLDWSRSFLEPVTCTFAEKGLCLKASGEQIFFEGKILSVAPECAEIKIVTEEPSENLLTFSAEIKITRQEAVNLVTWFDGLWSGFDEILDYKTNYSSICTFLRKGNISFFLSLDFPYSSVEKGKISYDPLDPVSPEEEYSVYSVTAGAARLTGEFPSICGETGKCDRGEIEAFSEYIEKRFPARMRRPLCIAGCITNRMTDVREGRIFYSMHDNPTVALDPQTLHREIDLCAELGIEYYQIFEGYFDFPGGIDCEGEIRRLTAHGRQAGVRVGGYVTPGGPYCPHYDYEHRDFGHPEWLRRDKAGNPAGFHCLGSGYTDYIAQILVNAAKRNGDEMICLDMWNIVPCFDSSHPHNPGSVFAEVRGLVRLMQALAEIGPEFLIWTNAGLFNEIAPKIAWYNPSLYLTDPHARQYISSLSLLKYYGDCRREQMVSVHNKYFLPYSYFSNCEYYVFRHSRVDDTAFFEYSLLQGLCVTPNICFGELRTFLERIPVSKLEHVKSFIKKWLMFINENYDVWKHTFQISGVPGKSLCEIYSHIVKSRGFLCIINPLHQSGNVSFDLDESIGLSEGEEFLISEEYPGQMPVAEHPVPSAKFGERIFADIPPYSVRILRIEEYTPSEAGLRIFGLEGKPLRTENGFSITVSGETGRTYNAAVSLNAADSTVVSVRAETVKTVPMYTFPASLSNVKISGGTARFALTMPRDRFCREIGTWRIDGGEPCCLSALTNGFRGAYIHNLYSETTSVTIEVETRTSTRTSPEETLPERISQQPSDHGTGKIYEAEFSVPFIEWDVSALPYGFDEVIELVFSDPARVENIKANIDGIPREVSKFYFPGRAVFTYYIELTGVLSSGTIPRLRLEIEWKTADSARDGIQAGRSTPEPDVQVLGQSG